MKVQKRILLVVFSLLLALSVIMSLNSIASSKKTTIAASGFSGNSLNLAGNVVASPKSFTLGQKVTGTPNTIEAYIKVPTTANEGKRYGVVIGNFVRGNAADSDCFDLEIHGGGNPRLFWHNGTYSGKDTDGTAKGFSWRLTSVNIANNTWKSTSYDAYSAYLLDSVEEDRWSVDKFLDEVRAKINSIL